MKANKAFCWRDSRAAYNIGNAFIEVGQRPNSVIICLIRVLDGGAVNYPEEFLQHKFCDHE